MALVAEIGIDCACMVYIGCWCVNRTGKPSISAQPCTKTGLFVKDMARFTGYTNHSWGCLNLYYVKNGGVGF